MDCSDEEGGLIGMGPQASVPRATTSPAEDLLTVAQAAAESGFSVKTIRRHIEKGALPIVRRGPFRRVRIRRDVFIRYLES